MAANSPDAPLNTAEIQELRRLIAARHRFGSGVDPLAATLVGVFAAGFLGLIGWMGYETMENGKATVALQTDVVVLKADVGELSAGQEKLDARLVRLEAGQNETNRKLDRLLMQRER